LKRTRLPGWWVVAFLLPALVSSFSIYRRYQAETLNRATAFSVEYETIENLAAAQEVPVDTAIHGMKAQGLNAVVLSEETIAEMIARGRATMTAGYDAKAGRDVATLRVPDPADLARVRRGLFNRLHFLAGSLVAHGDVLTLPPVSPMLVRATSVGLNPGQADTARRNGLFVIGRFVNPPGVSAFTVEATLRWAQELGMEVFLPQGDQVLGRRDAIPAMIDSLRKLGVLYATAEFSKIGGDEEVVRMAPEIVVRLHSAQEADLDKLKFVEAVDRYAKASRERNMRILLLRPFTFGAPKPLVSFNEFLAKIAEQIRNEGGSLGAPKPFGEPHLPRWYALLIGLTILPAAWLVSASFFTDRRVRTVGGVLLALLALACLTRHGAQFMAFAASLIFPIAAFLVLDALRPRNSLLGFWIVSAVSLVGGLCVAGMLNGLPYYIMAEQFLGVKVSIFLPILVVGYLFLDRLANTKDIWRSPITWGTAGLGLVIVVLLGVMIARTGNDTGIGPSGGESMFRGLLDRIMYVRPRTKEFLIGHPLLIVGIGMLSRLTLRREAGKAVRPGMENWTVLVIMVGSMGQTSIVNTLTHLHIPVMLSLARIGLGAIIGCIIGAGLWAVASRLLFAGDEA
jgi:hypothetical protein